MAKKSKSPGPLKKLATKIGKNISKLTKPAARPLASAKVKTAKPAVKPGAAKASVPIKSNSPQKKSLAPVKEKPVKTKPVAKAKAEAVPVVDDKKSAKTADKKGLQAKKDKKAKKTEEFELDDGLVGDEDLGSEDIPDLADFDEDETASEEIEEVEIITEEEVLSVVTEAQSGDEEIVLTDAEGRRYCRVRDCDQIASVEAYCRYHYLLLWKRIQVRRRILADGKLARYVEELTSRYPDKFLEVIRKDLRSEKDFQSAIQEFEIDESADNEFDNETDGFIEEVRGISENTNTISDEEEF